jgi:hypothetical protein
VLFCYTITCSGAGVLLYGVWVLGYVEQLLVLVRVALVLL